MCWETEQGLLAVQEAYNTVYGEDVEDWHKSNWQ